MACHLYNIWIGTANVNEETQHDHTAYALCLKADSYFGLWSQDILFCRVQLAKQVGGGVGVFLLGCLEIHFCFLSNINGDKTNKQTKCSCFWIEERLWYVSVVSTVWNSFCILNSSMHVNYSAWTAICAWTSWQVRQIKGYLDEFIDYQVRTMLGNTMTIQLLKNSLNDCSFILKNNNY